MSNIKKRDFYNVVTGDKEYKNDYGINASTFMKVDNVDMIFDSRGQYLGIRTCRGKFINGKYTSKEGIRDFKSFMDMEIWNGVKCARVDYVESRDGVFAEVRKG